MKQFYSRLKSPISLNGRVKDKPFSVLFGPDKKTSMKDEEYEALISEENGALSCLIAQGDFVQDAEAATSEIAELKSKLKKTEAALKKAEEEAKRAEKEQDEEAVKEAEAELAKAEQAFSDCADPAQKKELKKAVDKAKKVLKEVK